MTPKTTLLTVMCCLLFLVGDISTQGQQTSLPGFSTGMVRWQKGSPAQLVSIRSSIASLFDGAILMNTSDQPVIGIQVGCLVESRDNSGSAFTMVSPTLPVEVASDQGAVVRSSFWSVEEVQREAADRGMKKFNVTFGIVRAKFSDGHEYHYDLQQTKKFVREDSSTIDSIYRKLDQETLQNSLSEK
jgi:hypothetical protein